MEQDKITGTEKEQDTEIDYVGNSKLRKQRQRFNLRLNYDSDSSDEDYVKKDTPADKQDDEDDDMFASDDETDAKDKSDGQDTGKEKKALLDMDEFERTEGIGKFEQQDQVVLEHPITAQDDDLSEDIGDSLKYYNNVENFEDISEIRALKKVEPKIEAFDLRQEAQDGQFEADGNYIPNTVSDEEEEKIKGEDQWANDFNKSDILKAKQAKLKREQAQLSKTKTSISSEILLQDLIEMLEPAETPMEALARLKPPKKKNKKNTSLDHSQDQLRKQLVLKLTDICEQLINEKHVHETYDMSREELMRLYKQETGDSYTSNRGAKRSRDEADIDSTADTGDKSEALENEEDFGDKIWEFKWLGEDTINGPYSNYEMKYWKETYFDNKVEVRKIGESQFNHVKSISFDDV